MFVTVLGRLYESGGSELGAAAKIRRFSDAEVGSWYYDYMNWAAENGIVQGYSPDKFAPYAPVTREQIAAFLYRYAKTSGYDMTYKETNALSYMADGGDTSEWADVAMSWAISTSLIRGRHGEIVDPRGIATRAEVAQIFMRFEDLFGRQ
jgi:hypothetical protein